MTLPTATDMLSDLVRRQTRLVFCPYAKHGSEYTQSDEVLRFAIRSWCAHLGDELRFVLIGEKPDWYAGEHIEHPRGPEKYRNVLARMRVACEVSLDEARQVAEVVRRKNDWPVFAHNWSKRAIFTWTNDDIFIGDTWIRDWPQYHQDPLANTAPQYGGEYRALALRTVELCGEHVLNFGMHCPFQFRAPELLALLDELGDEPALVRTVYAHRHPGVQQEMTDRKAFNGPQVQELAQGPWWSINDSGPVVAHALGVLRKRFPEPCELEA